MRDSAEILHAIRVVSDYNKPIADLGRRWEEYALSTSQYKRGAKNALGDGQRVFEYLCREAPQLADTIHDFVYQIACPHLSLTNRNLAREEVAKTVLNLV